MTSLISKVRMTIDFGFCRGLGGELFEVRERRREPRGALGKRSEKR